MNPAREVGAALLTGGFDKHYTFGLAMALAAEDVSLEIIGGDTVDCPAFHNPPKLAFLNLRGSKEENTGLMAKVSRVLLYYARLVRYAACARPKVFHILWNNKFEFFDRTLLMLYYKLMGKKICFTAHNINEGKRDFKDSVLNRLTLRIQYRLADRVFVHTDKMKQELLEEFGVRDRAVCVIPYGINNSVPHTDLTSREAKQRLGVSADQKTILFFGAIRPSKGLDYLVDAFLRLAAVHPEYRLIIAGETRKETKDYFDKVRQTIDGHPNRSQVIQRIEYIPDEETEVYFKAADVIAMPYTLIFQSGVLFLAHSFGLPVVASDVGSFREDITEGRTGFLCRPCDAADLSRAIEQYFASDLFQTLDWRRHEIQARANARHSWSTVGKMTREVYAGLLGEN